MYNQTIYFHNFYNQVQYLIGQLLSLQICLLGERNDGKVLHLTQSLNGGAFNSLGLLLTAFREDIYTLTNTLLSVKNMDEQTRSNVLAIREAAATLRPVKLPGNIIMLNSMIKFYDLKPIG